jgi:hypothetical protein
MIDRNNLNLSICRFKVNCQIRKFKITKLKQQVMPTYYHIDSTNVIESDYTFFTLLVRLKLWKPYITVCECDFTYLVLPRTCLKSLVHWLPLLSFTFRYLLLQQPLLFSTLFVRFVH